MNRTDLVRAAAWFDALVSEAKAQGARVRRLLYDDAKAEYEEQGTAPTWRIREVATVIGSVSHQAVHVADAATFAAWVQARYPTEVEVIVRPTWSDGFLKRVIVAPKFDDAVVVDPGTGEVVPGLSVSEGGRFTGISIRVTSEAKDVYGSLAGQVIREMSAIAAPAAAAVLDELDADTAPQAIVAGGGS